MSGSNGKCVKGLYINPKFKFGLRHNTNLHTFLAKKYKALISKYLLMKIPTILFFFLSFYK